MPLMKCPECSREVSSAAAACPGCGHPIAAWLSGVARGARAVDPPSAATGSPPVQQTIVVQQRKWSPGIAAVLSLLVPGLGQLYKTQILNGIVWFLVVITGYFLLVIPGLVLHLFCIIGAASGDPMK
jgi:TM2 domain-containing membrane protein YozV